VQALLRRWSAASRRANPAVMLDQAAMPWFAELNRSLRDTLDDAGFRARIRASTVQLRQLASEILARARAADPGVDAGGLVALLAENLGFAPLTAGTDAMLFEAAPVDTDD
jgi:hypothetical protein